APQNITFGQVANLLYTPEPIEIRRVNQYRAITVTGLPKPGHVASEATDPLMPALRKFEAGLPEGYRMEIVGELKEQIKGQRQSLNVVLASVIAIYLALDVSVQERHQAVDRVCRYSLRRRRRAGRCMADAYAAGFHGNPG